jgi:fumarate reductase subunit D
MKALMLKLEPIIWQLFGGGMMIGAFLYPAYLLMVGFAAPLGIAPPEALSYERAIALAGSIAGRAILAAAIALPLWAAAHHVRHIFIDFGGLARDGTVGALCYGIAALGSLLAIVAVIRL